MSENFKILCNSRFLLLFLFYSKDFRRALSTFGIHYKAGDAVNIFYPATSELKTELLEDELNFDVENSTAKRVKIIDGSFDFY